MLSVALAGLALAISGSLSWLSWRTSQDGLSLAQQASARELARSMFLGEITNASTKGRPARTVTNANTVDLYRVWVEGSAGGKSANAVIGTVPACTYYQLPVGYIPHKLRFFDGTRSWSRDAEGALTEAPDPPAVPARNDVPTDEHRLPTCG
jgi:hypothetical protein